MVMNVSVPRLWVIIVGAARPKVHLLREDMLGPVRADLKRGAPNTAKQPLADGRIAGR